MRFTLNVRNRNFNLFLNKNVALRQLCASILQVDPFIQEITFDQAEQLLQNPEMAPEVDDGSRRGASAPEGRHAHPEAPFVEVGGFGGAGTAFCSLTSPRKTFRTTSPRTPTSDYVTKSMDKGRLSLL